MDWRRVNGCGIPPFNEAPPCQGGPNRHASAAAILALPIGEEQTNMAQSSWAAIIGQDDGWWIGWIAEVPGVNAQERTREDLLDTLADVLREALALNRQDALAHV